jgi:large subunit ribosomal protein L9
MIEVILLERIERLGTLGQTVKVRPGFARNFLLPNKKALRATKANVELFEKQRAVLEARNADERAAAEALAAKMDGLAFVVIRQASEMGQLFGSVTARDIVEVAAVAGHQLNRSQVHIHTPIKALGLFSVKIKLHPEVAAKVIVNVARSPEEATVQAQKSDAANAAAAKKAQVEAAFGAPVTAPEGTDSAPVTEEKPKKARKTKKADAEKAEEKDEKEEAPKTKKPAKKAKKADAE